MHIDEAAAIVAGPRTPALAEAIQALWQFVQVQAKKAGATDDEAEDIAQDILSKILPRLQSGDRVWDGGNHCAYLKACARNSVASLRRISGRDRATVSQEPSTAQSTSNEVGELFDAAREFIAAAARFARSQRKPRYLEPFDQAWGELQDIVYEEKPLDEILKAKLGPDADRATYEKARNSAYKSHERIRGELQRGVTQLCALGELTAAQAEFATRALRVFVRCQRGARVRVTPEKGSA